MAIETQPTTKSLTSAVKENVVFQSIAGITVLVSLLGTLNDAGVSRTFISVIAAVVVCIVVSVVYNIRKQLRTRVLPPTDGDFSPFSGGEGWQPWKRDRITIELASTIDTAVNKHVLLVSPSGTGKSTMLSKLLPARLPQYDIINVSDYGNVIEDILEKMLSVVRDEKDIDNILKLIQISNFSWTGHRDFSDQLDKTFDSFTAERKILLCFDQVERYFLQRTAVDSTKSMPLEISNMYLREFLGKIASCAHIRSVFAIRSEYIFGSLSNLFNSKPNGSDVDDNIEFYFMWGVNMVDDHAIVNELSNKLEVKIGLPSVIKSIMGAANTKNQMEANSFVLNLGGYIYEKLYDRQEYHALLNEANVSSDTLIDIYLDASFEGYKACGNSADRDAFDTILYTLASESKVSGQACDANRLSGLAHYPLDEVNSVTTYLWSTGALRRETLAGAEAYRISHEKLSDRLLKSHTLHMNSESIDGIRSLTENRIPTEKLTIPRSFPRPIEPSWPWGYAVVLIFVAYGLLRLAFREDVFGLIQSLGIDSSIERVFGYKTHMYYMQPTFYVPHFLAHIAWVSYIDRLNRGYLQNVCGPFLRSIGNSLSTVGVILGVIVSYTPELFWLPVVSVGFVFGLILIALSVSITGNGGIKYNTMWWGIRTCINLGVVAGVAHFLIASYLDVADGVVVIPGNNAVFVTIFCEGAMLLWFWWHITPGQNTRRVWAANLALFDKARTKKTS